MADLSEPEPTTPDEPGRLRGRAILGAVLLLHAVLAFRLFPGLGSIVDDGPVVMVDHAIHEYHGALGARALRQAGTTWGIDPFFMAGYPETPVWDSSSNLAILFQWLAGGYSPRAYKLGLLACSLLTLAAIPLAARVAGLDWGETAGASALALIYFWGGYPAGLWRTGLFAFITASACAGLLLALCSRFDERPSRRAWLGLAATGSALFFMHVTAPIMLLGGLLIFYATAARRHGARWHAAVLGAAGLAVVANLVWLVPLLRFRGIREGGALFLNAESAWFFLAYLAGLGQDSFLGPVLIVLGAAGLVLWARDGRRATAAVAGAAAFLFVLATFGSLWGPTRVLEPLRFLLPMSLLLALPAGSAVARASAGLARALGGGRWGAAAVVVAWLAALVAGGAAMPSVTWRLLNHRPLAVGLAPEMTELVEWLRSNTDPSARILFEDQLRILEMTDPESTHWTPLLPVLLGRDPRQFLGGLYQTAFIRHHRMAAFGDFHLGDRPIDRWPPGALGGYLDLYNVGWVACWSPLSRFWFDRLATARRVATLPRFHTAARPPYREPQQGNILTRLAGPHVAARYLDEGDRRYAIYRIDRPHSFALRGQARVVSQDFNRVELADVVPHDGSVLLSLHWIDGWRTDPPAKAGPEAVPLDPVAFVRIDLPGPVPRLVLYNGYGRR